MPTEGTRLPRRAVRTALKADAGVTALVSASAIDPPGDVAAWPAFIRSGTFTAAPILASCVDGDSFAFSVHTFAKPRFDGTGAMLETAEDHCDRIGTAVLRALHGTRLELDSGNTMRVRRAGYQLIRDGAEADAWHHIANFVGRVLS